MDVTTELKPEDQAIVILEQEEMKLHAITDVVACDAHTAITRGLASYFAAQALVDVSGREHRLAHAFDTYAEPEEEAKYPYLAVYGLGAGDYEALGFTPAMLSRCPLVTRGDRGKYIYATHELSLPVIAEVWAEDAGDRTMMAAMIEQASVPALFTSGLRLVLPFYFNQTASYELVGVEYADSAQDDVRRYRKLRVRYRTNLSVTRSMDAGKARVQARGTVTQGPLDPEDE